MHVVTDIKWNILLHGTLHYDRYTCTYMTVLGCKQHTMMLLGRTSTSVFQWLQIFSASESTAETAIGKQHVPFKESHIEAYTR